MNKFRKICLSVLATVLCFAMLMIVPMVTKANTEPTIVVSSAEASAGEEVAVTISLKNNPGIVSMALYVEYDTNVLTLKKVEDTGLLSGQTHPNSMEVYPYALTWENDSLTENLYVNGDLVTLTFEVASDITTKKSVDINVSYDNSDFDIYDVNLNTIDFAVSNGKVTIDKMPTPVALENGSVAIQSFGVDKSGDVPVAKASAYEDYLFAGWFKSVDCTMENAITDASKVTSDSYAKFIPSEVLGIKAQVANDGSGVMRFISSVDCLTYKSVGFEVTQGSTKKSYQTSTVYERIQSNTNGVEYGFSSKVVDTASNYLVTAKLQAEENKDYTVRVYVVTMDGQKVYGPSRCLGLLDGEDTNKINVVYKSENAPAVGSIIDVTYGKDNTATKAEVLAVDGKDVSVRVNVTTTLPSATKFTFGSTGSAIYRNLYTKYTGTGTADTTWYDVYFAADSSETEFTIATNADMYGFMNLYAGKNLFKGKTLYVISDIAMNDNVTKATVESWANGTEAPYKWTPSGNNSGKRFQGTFDGQMHKLSGFYVNESKYYVGLFGDIDLGGVVKNFYLEDSYFTTTGGAIGDTMYAYLGSVAGENRGTISNIYSNAIVASNAQRVGGIVGVHNTTVDVENAGKQAIVENCWFDGEVRLFGDNGKVGGGIIGLIMQRETTTKNVLFTGKVTATTSGEACIGGILGSESTQTGALANNINMVDCIAVGTVSASVGATSVGSAVGKAAGAASIYYMMNVYADSAKGALVGGGTAKFPGLAVAKETLYGTTAYQKTLLDLENTWGARTSATPVLRTFTEKYNANDVVNDFTGLKRDQWYDANMKAYGIHNVDEFKQFSVYSDAYNFYGMYIGLLDDMDLNPGWTAPKSGIESISGNPEKWKPIAADGKKFTGTFDGRKYEIRGMYVEGDGHYQSLIGCIDNANAKVTNVSLVNSYVKANGSGNVFVGSVVGYAYGTVTNVYSEAVVVSAGAEFGGVIGRAEGTVSNCWFNGEVYSTAKAAKYFKQGGVIGTSWSQTGKDKPCRPLTVTNCLNTGKVVCDLAPASTTNVGIGGILGGDRGYTKITMSNCVDAGIIVTKQTVGVGSVVGNMAQNLSGVGTSNGTISNCYGKTIIGNKASTITLTDNVTIEPSALVGAQVYNNASVELESAVWIARTSDTVIPTVFVNWIVPASETVAKPAN